MSWKSTLSITRFVFAVDDEPASIAPFSSVTLPTRLFFSVTLVAPPCSKTAPVVLVRLASRSSPSNVMLSASDFSCRILLPAIRTGVDLHDVAGRGHAVGARERLARGRLGALGRVRAGRRDVQGARAGGSLPTEQQHEEKQGATQGHSSLDGVGHVERRTNVVHTRRDAVRPSRRRPPG